jgi:UDPglucose 6-dehydrogenase
MPATKAVLPENGDTVVYCEDAYTAAQHAHLLIVLTEWPEYSSLDLRRLRDAMDVPVVIDGRNVFDPAAITKLGFEYQCIGR